MNDVFRYELYHDGIVQDYKNTLIVIAVESRYFPNRISGQFHLAVDLFC